MTFTLSVPAFAQTNQELNNMESIAAGDNKSSTRIAFIDPKTGKLTSKPAGQQQADMLSKNKSQSITLSGVASEPQLQSDGSSKIDFNGQFMKPIRVEINSKGEVHSGHHLPTEIVNKD